jgi:hypothetical protein
MSDYEQAFDIGQRHLKKIGVQIDFTKPEKQKFTIDNSMNTGDIYRVFTDRYSSFCLWLFSRPERDFVISGHKLWLQTFFRRTLNNREKNIAEKIFINNQIGDVRVGLENSSIIYFEIEDIKSKKLSCRVASKSTQLLYGNWRFTGKPKHDNNIAIGNIYGSISASEQEELKSAIRKTIGTDGDAKIMCPAQLQSAAGGGAKSP